MRAGRRRPALIPAAVAIVGFDEVPAARNREADPVLAVLPLREVPAQGNGRDGLESEGAERRQGRGRACRNAHRRAIEPGRLRFDLDRAGGLDPRTTTRARPLNSFRRVPTYGSSLVPSPLPTAAMVPGPVMRELDLLVGVRLEAPVRVDRLHDDEREVLSVRRDRGAIRRQAQPRGRTRRRQHALGHATIAVHADGLQRARRIRNGEDGLELLFAPGRQLADQLVVEEQADLLGSRRRPPPAGPCLRGPATSSSGSSGRRTRRSGSPSGPRAPAAAPSRTRGRRRSTGCRDSTTAACGSP